MSPASTAGSFLGDFRTPAAPETLHESGKSAFARRLAAKGVTGAEWALMRTLYPDEQIAPSAIASGMGMTRGTVTKLSDRLIAKGFLLRADNPQDGRAHTLALTPSARALVPKLAALADQNDAEFFGHLTLKERATLERMLREIVARQGMTAVPTN